MRNYKSFGDNIWFFEEELRREPVKTKVSHPYSYDPIILYDSGKETNGDAWTDRLFEWDYKKAESLGQKHMQNKRWNNAAPSQIEGFLREYMEKPNLELVKVTEFCNQATGFTTWRLDFIV